MKRPFLVALEEVPNLPVRKLSSKMPVKGPKNRGGNALPLIILLCYYR